VRENTTLVKALEYAARGWKVFPLTPMRKIPFLPGGYKIATSDEHTIRGWFEQGKPYNIGVAAGTCSGIVLIDFDTYKNPNATPQGLAGYLMSTMGDDHSNELLQAFQNAPCFRTARGGLQLIFKAGTLPLKCTSNIGNFAGIDLRADGGYSALPPSKTGDGKYEWIRDCEPDVMPAMLERWILGNLNSPAEPYSIPTDVRGWLQTKAPRLLAGRTRHCGSGIMVQCPAHDDRNPSLHVQIYGDRVLLHCFAGCRIETILDALRLKWDDLFLDNGKSQPPARSKTRIKQPTKEKKDSLAESVIEKVASQKDYGHARELAHLFAGRFRWAHKLNCWMRYVESEGRWVEAPEESVFKEASDALRRHYAAKLLDAEMQEAKELQARLKDTTDLTRMRNALSFLKGWEGILTYPHEWDSNPWLLNVKNGTLDLQTFNLLRHSPDHLITKFAPVAYDPAAPASLWLEHLEALIPDMEVRRQLQRDLGAALPGAVLEECLPIWYGTGCNGKSTTAGVIMRVLGDYVCRAAPRLLVQDRFARHPTEIADLVGRRLAFSIETEHADHLAEAVVKDLTGGDRKKARFMHRDFFEFEQTFTLILLANHKPIISGSDYAIWRRVRLIPWTQEIPQEKRREQSAVINELLEDCGSGILNWLLDGLRDFRFDRNWVAQAVRAATLEYKEEMDVLAPFIEERCELQAQAMIPKRALYDAYVAWCELAGEKPLSHVTFSKRIKERGIRSERLGGAKTHTYVGIRLRSTC